MAKKANGGVQPQPAGPQPVEGDKLDRLLALVKKYGPAVLDVLLKLLVRFESPSPEPVPALMLGPSRSLDHGECLDCLIEQQTAALATALHMRCCQSGGYPAETA